MAPDARRMGQVHEGQVQKGFATDICICHLPRKSKFKSSIVVFVIQVRDRCRKGVPSSIRPRAWQYLCGGNYLMSQNKGSVDDFIVLQEFNFIFPALLCVSQHFRRVARAARRPQMARRYPKGPSPSISHSRNVYRVRRSRVQSTFLFLRWKLDFFQLFH